jgi:hypothetical protein
MTQSKHDGDEVLVTGIVQIGHTRSCASAGSCPDAGLSKRRGR